MLKGKKKLVVLTAGGTGGHVYPAEALACELENRGCRVMLFTDKRGLNNYKGKLGEIENKAICSGNVVGKSLKVKIQSLFKVGIGVLQAIYWLLRTRPVCVVGFGGYASFPTGLAAVILRVPLVLHEQNSVMSRTNRILVKFASVVAQSFRDVRNTPAGVKSVLSGMPVRKNIADLYSKPIRPRNVNGKMTMIVLGGSQGAKVFAEVVPDAIIKLDRSIQKNMKIYQQCRKGEEDEIKALYEGTDVELVVNSFFCEMEKLYDEADFIVSRSGASSVCEIAAVGLPSVLVPLPIAADNHQYYNAKEFADRSAGIVLDQKNFDAEALKNIIEDFYMNPQKLVKMSNEAKKIAIVDAAERLANVVENVCKK